MSRSATSGARPSLRDPGGRFLPSRDALDRRSTPELLETMRRFGLAPDARRISSVVDAAIGQTRAADRPDLAMLREAVERAEAAMRRELAREAKDYVRRVEMEAHGLRGRGTAEREATWLSVGDDRVCESCDGRHGELATMREWNGRGVPGSENLVCNGRCRCELIPEEWLAGEETSDADDE